MILTVVPSGPQATFRLGLAWLIASSPSFRTIVGEVDAAHALAHVLTEADDTELSGSARPRAIVHPQSFSRTVIQTGGFNQGGSVMASFEFPPSSGVHAETPTETRLWDEMLEFENRLDAIINDMIAAQGVGTGYTTGFTQVSFNTVTLDAGPVSISETREEGSAGEVSQYFYASRFRFDWQK